MDLHLDVSNENGKILPEEKYMVARCNPDNISEDYLPIGKVRSYCGTKQFLPTLFKRMCGGEDLRFFHIFNIVYTAVYIGVHISFTVLYQFYRRCDNKDSKVCKDVFTPFVEKAEKDFDLLPTVIAFLMGFYVNMVCVRWWDQICLLPDTDNVALYLATYTTGKHQEAELELKKKILRYLNLSWALAMSRVSSCMYKHFPDQSAYIDKKLVTKEETEDMKLSGPDNRRSGHWFVPLDKAVEAIGEGYKNNLFSVYPEDLVREVVQYRKDLQTLLDYNSNPLPIIFSQTVGLVLVFWGILGALKVTRSYDNMGVLDYLTHIPLFRLLTLGMLLNWFLVCVKLLNPFGSDRGYDVDLPSELDLNIWKSSVMIWKQDVIRIKKAEENGTVKKI